MIAQASGCRILVVAIGVATGICASHIFGRSPMHRILARQLAPLQIVVIGQLFALLSGGLDLSVASVMACFGVVGILAWRMLVLSARLR